MERLCSSDIPSGNCRKCSFPVKRGMLLISRNLRTQFKSFKFNIVGKVYIINNSDVLANNARRTQIPRSLGFMSMAVPMAQTLLHPMENRRMKLMKKYNWLMTIGAVSMLGFLSQPARAIPTLTLSDGGSNTVTILDNGAGDLNPALGAVTFLGSVGIFDLNVSTGLTKPAQGSAAAPQIDLNSIDTSTGAGTLTITFSEDGFTGFPGTFHDHFGGTQTNGSIVNTVLQNGMLLVTNGPFSTASFAGDASGALTGGAPYSLTQSVALTFSGPGMKSFDAGGNVAVPDGGMTVTLLGLGLAGLAGVGRLRQRLVKA